MKKFLLLLVLFPVMAFADCSNELTCCPSAAAIPLSYGGLPDGWQVHPLLARPQGGVDAVFEKAIISALGGMSVGVTCIYQYKGGEFALFLPSKAVVRDTRFRPWSKIYGGFQCSKARERCRFVSND